MEIENFLWNDIGSSGILPMGHGGISHRTVLCGTKGIFLFPLFVSKEQYEVFNVCNKVKNSTSCRKIGACLFFCQPDSSHSLVVSSIIEPETQHMWEFITASEDRAGIYCQVTLLPATLCTVSDLPVRRLYCYLHTVFLYVDSFFYFKNRFDVTWMEKPV